MKAMLATVLAMALLAGLAGQASAASSKQRGYKASPAPRTAKPALRSPRGYLPPRGSARKSGGEYDFPAFGSKRWWQLQEDRD